MTRMAHTSLMAYFGFIEPDLQDREKDVLDVFTQNTTLTFTNCELGYELGLPDKSITGRTNRLRGLGKNNPFKDKPYLVVYEKRKCLITGYTAQAMALHPDTFRVFT